MKYGVVFNTEEVKSSSFNFIAFRITWIGNLIFTNGLFLVYNLIMINSE